MVTHASPAGFCFRLLSMDTIALDVPGCCGGIRCEWYECAESWLSSALSEYSTLAKALFGTRTGTLQMCRFWDWKSGNRFQEGQTIVQPGSLESEAGIYAASFDVSGSRLLTAEADKTIKFWKEDQSATPETHPVVFRPPKDIRRY